MERLPAELLINILDWSLLDRTSSAQVLMVCRTWHDVGIHILHRDLEFRSQSQLHLFLQQCESLCTSPRSITISLAGAAIRPQSRIFGTIGAVWRKYESETLQHVDLCLNSHSLDPYPSLIGEAMLFINPGCFRWSGPDPPHHWSTAIVPTATQQLCTGLARWDRLHSLHLSHIAFPRHHSEDAFAAALVEHPHPVLQRISLSQAVFLSADVVANIATNLKSLQQFRLVDCYVDSIWGPRLRLGDVERAVHTEEDWSRVHAVVKCEARLERIQGGDRGS